MGKTFVTGGTGFVGAHLVRALLRRGDAVRCLVRSGSRRTNLEGLDVEIVLGDLTAPESLEHAMLGVDKVFHCAADYRLFVRRKKEIYRTNVDGTRNVLAAAARAGVCRVVYTSTVGVLGLRADGVPAIEDTPVSFGDMIGDYKKSKFLAEREALRFASEGLPVVVVNPSTPVGPMDVRPTPTGKIVVDFLNRKMPCYVDTGLNLVAVEDVAAGHLLADERGRIGERYILGNENLTLRRILQILSDLSGLPAPRIRLPHAVPLVIAAIHTAAAYAFGTEPKVPLTGARLARHHMYFDAGKAVRELGLPQTPVEVALAQAVEWFSAHGYVDGTTGGREG